jgi:hypothetical protein
MGTACPCVSSPLAGFRTPLPRMIGSPTCAPALCERPLPSSSYFTHASLHRSLALCASQTNLSPKCPQLSDMAEPSADHIHVLHAPLKERSSASSLCAPAPGTA